MRKPDAGLVWEFAFLVVVLVLIVGIVVLPGYRSSF